MTRWLEVGSLLLLLLPGCGAGSPVRVLLANGRQLESRPRTHTLPGVAWRRVRGVPDERCVKR